MWSQKLMPQMVPYEQLLFGLSKLYFYYYYFRLKIDFFFFFCHLSIPCFVGFGFGKKIVFEKTSHTLVCVVWSQAQGHIDEQVLNIFNHRRERDGLLSTNDGKDKYSSSGLLAPKESRCWWNKRIKGNENSRRPSSCSLMVSYSGPPWHLGIIRLILDILLGNTSYLPFWGGMNPFDNTMREPYCLYR